jgi:hypothetical protein
MYALLVNGHVARRTQEKRSNNVLIVSGVLKTIFPDMITNTIAVVIISVVLIFDPFFIKR